MANPMPGVFPSIFPFAGGTQVHLLPIHSLDTYLSIMFDHLSHFPSTRTSYFESSIS